VIQIPKKAERGKTGKGGWVHVENVAHGTSLYILNVVAPQKGKSMGLMAQLEHQKKRGTRSSLK